MTAASDDRTSKGIHPVSRRGVGTASQVRSSESTVKEAPMDIIGKRVRLHIHEICDTCGGCTDMACEMDDVHLCTCE